MGNRRIRTKLKARRVDLGYTQDYVAEVVGIRGPSYNAIERGAGDGRVQTMQRIAEFLGISLDDACYSQPAGSDDGEP